MRSITFVTSPGYSVIALAALSVFETANMLADEPYSFRFVSEAGGAVGTSLGMRMETERFTDEPGDTLVIGGGATSREPPTPSMIELVRAAARSHRRITAICTGAFILAEAGLLDGRRATTHWAYARELQKRFPKAKVDEDRIFINDGPIWTSAGMSAGVDLALALVEDDLGAEVAKSVARKLVLYHRRGGGQSQFSTLLELSPKSDRIQTALAFARENLHTPLTVPQLADAANLSPRQFSRAFRSETGQSPAKAIENLRVEAARALMEQSSHPIDVVARQTGFSDRDHMRRAFLRAFGQPPQVLRRNRRNDATDWQNRTSTDGYAATVTRHGKLPPRRHEELPPPQVAEESMHDRRANRWKPVVERSTGGGDEDAGRRGGDVALEGLRLGRQADRP